MSPRCVVVQREVIEETLRSSPRPGKNLLEPMKSLAARDGLPFKILEDTAVSTSPEIHMTEGDLWCCLSGEVEFRCGGALADSKPFVSTDGIENPNELRGSRLEGGENVVLRTGDWLWIPPGEPHAHSCAGTARLLIVKIPIRMP